MPTTKRAIDFSTYYIFIYNKSSISRIIGDSSMLLSVSLFDKRSIQDISEQLIEKVLLKLLKEDKVVEIGSYKDAMYC